MQTLPPGANANIAGSQVLATVHHGNLSGIDCDIAAFLVTSAGKVRTDADMIFYGATQTADGAVRLTTGHVTSEIGIDLARVPAEIEKIVITATIFENRATFGQWPALSFTVTGFNLEIPLAGRAETALILGELYRRNGQWKLRCVAQGFNGGLGPLATHLGVTIAAEVPAAPAQPVSPPPAPPAPPKSTIDLTRPRPAAPPAGSNINLSRSSVPIVPRGGPSSSSVNLEKRLVDLQKRDPGLVSLVKKVQVSLEKKGVQLDQAKVALCLDISGSMHDHYVQGRITTLINRVMALGYRFDDDGEIDVFLFGRDGHQMGAVGVDGYRNLVPRILREYGLEDSTAYARAMQFVRRHYAADVARKQPVYVMFVTDGEPMDPNPAKQQMREASNESIFWKFMGLTSRGMFGRMATLQFLDDLDNLPGRTVDNAHSFYLEDPASPTDEQMFDLMMEEYPAWIRDARARGILA